MYIHTYYTFVKLYKMPLSEAYYWIFKFVLRLMVGLQKKSLITTKGAWSFLRCTALARGLPSCQYWRFSWLALGRDKPCGVPQQLDKSQTRLTNVCAQQSCILAYFFWSGFAGLPGRWALSSSSYMVWCVAGRVVSPKMGIDHQKRNVDVREKMAKHHYATVLWKGQFRGVWLDYGLKLIVFVI